MTESKTSFWGARRPLGDVTGPRYAESALRHHAVDISFAEADRHLQETLASYTRSGSLRADATLDGLSQLSWCRWKNAPYRASVSFSRTLQNRSFTQSAEIGKCRHLHLIKLVALLCRIMEHTLLQNISACYQLIFNYSAYIIISLYSLYVFICVNILILIY